MIGCHSRGEPGLPLCAMSKDVDCIAGNGLDQRRSGRRYHPRDDYVSGNPRPPPNQGEPDDRFIQHRTGVRVVEELVGQWLR